MFKILRTRGAKNKKIIEKEHFFRVNSLNDICDYYGWKTEAEVDTSKYRPSPGNLWQLNQRRYKDILLVLTAALNTHGDILEFGTSKGEMTALLASSANPSRLVHTLDILPSQLNKGKHITHTLEEDDIGIIYKNLGIQNVRQYFCDSIDWQPPEKGVDLALIDGCHDRAYVINDTKKALSVMKSGYILWHDCNPDLVVHFPWLNDVCLGVQDLVSLGLVKSPVLYLKDSFTAISQIS